MQKLFEIWKKIFSQYRTVILYFIIGINAAIIDLSLYLALFNLASFPAVYSTVISVSAATVFGFIMNTIFNFKVFDRLFFRFLSYSSVSGVGILLSAGLLYFFHDRLDFDGNLVKVASLPIVFITQYILNKAVSFKRSTTAETINTNQ